MKYEALNSLMVLPSNESEIERFVTTIKKEILSHGDDPLNVLKQMKMVEKTISILLKDKELDNYFIDEALKYGNSFEHLDTHFDVKEVGTRYDYSSCNDSTWKYLNEKVEKAEKDLKKRETFLKAIPLEGTVNPETGELIYSPAKSSTTKCCAKL